MDSPLPTEMIGHSQLLLLQDLRQIFFELQTFRRVSFEVIRYGFLGLLDLDTIVTEIFCHHRSLYEMRATGFVFLQDSLRLLSGHESNEKFCQIRVRGI